MARTKDEYIEEKPKKKSHWGLVILLLFLLIIAAGVFFAYRYYNASRFPKGITVNGVNVSGMTLDEATEAMNNELNYVDFIVDGKNIASTKTAFTYDAYYDLESKIKISNVDPRPLVGIGLDYDIPVTITGGYEESEKLIAEAIPDGDDIQKTKDAYIDYETLEIVSEVQGEDTDFAKVTEAVAKFKEADPTETRFELDRSKYVIKPSVMTGDLADELEFAEKNFAGGVRVECTDGSAVRLNSKQLSEIIHYWNGEITYDKDGASKVAKEVADEYMPFNMNIATCEGSKNVPNYVFEGSVNIEATAESLYNGFKDEGTEPTIVVNNNGDLSLEDRVEVALTSQTLYLVKDGQQVASWPVVSGRPGWETDPGAFTIYAKDTNAELVGDERDPYTVTVNYWMPFNGPAGLHDAIWLSEYGGEIYKTENGSHGCVGMSLENAKRLYSEVYVGMPVIVYY